jgi:hypothetical protein
MLRTAARLSLPLILLVPCLRAAEPSPAAGIAAKVIRERAQQVELAGNGAVAGELRALADQLAAGSVSLADAALVVQIALAGTPAQNAAPAMTPEQRKAATAAAAKATAILDGEPPAQVTAKADPPAAVIDEKALAIPVATTVLIASYVGEPKSLLVMIGAGKDQHITSGQRFAVKRADKPIAVISATQVKENSTICIAIPGTLAQGEEVKAGDSVVPE